MIGGKQLQVNQNYTHSIAYSSHITNFSRKIKYSSMSSTGIVGILRNNIPNSNVNISVCVNL